jgi:protein phosphatase
VSPKPLPAEVCREELFLQLEAAGESDRGYVRQRNEDAFGMVPEVGLYMVADGVSGREAGDVASRMAVDTVCEFVHRVHDTWPRRPRHAGDDPEAALFAAALRHANRAIYREGREKQPEGRGMTTTFVGALCSGDKLVVAHVGDSRAYRLRRGHLIQLTEDHCLGNEIGRNRRADEWLFAGVNPAALTRALGLFDTVEPTLAVDRPEPDDVLLLCSDGLTNMLDPHEIADIMTHITDVELCARALVVAANTAGGGDNTTVIVVRWRA